MTYSFDDFQSLATIILSGLAGALITVPLVASGSSWVLILLGLVFGLISGYKRRKSKLFFYLAIVSVLVMSSLISYGMK